MNVYTFYRKIHGHPFIDELDLIEMWKDSWSEYGWNPIVLGMDDIIKDDFFWKYYNIVSKLPTHNTLQFEISAWLREFSINQVSSRNNDSLFCVADYDMLNYGIRPDMFPNEPCYYRHFTLYPSIQSQETMNAWINLIIDKFTNQRNEYIDNGILISADGTGRSTMFTTSNMHFAFRLHDYDECPIKRNIAGELIYIEIDVDCRIHDMKQLINMDEKTILETKEFFYKRWKVMNIVHISGSMRGLWGMLFEQELGKPYNSITKADIVRYINKSNERL